MRRTGAHAEVRVAPIITAYNLLAPPKCGAFVKLIMRRGGLSCAPNSRSGPSVVSEYVLYRGRGVTYSVMPSVMEKFAAPRVLVKQRRCHPHG